MSAVRTSMSLVGFQSVAAVDSYRKAFPSMMFELSYKMSAAFLQAVRPVVQGRVSSVHACCPSEPIFPNLGSHDPAVVDESLKAIEASARTAASFGADILVLHPGYATDSAVPAENERRKVLLEGEQFKRYVWRPEGSICGPDYVRQPVYANHMARALDLLPTAANLCALYRVRLAVENLNPRVGYLFQTPDEMVALASMGKNLFLCLDVGHLWISSCVYGFDYMAAVRQVMATGKVINCHLHSNPSDRDRDLFVDNHDTFAGNGFPVASILQEVAVPDTNVVLETVHDPEGNTRALLKACCGR